MWAFAWEPPPNISYYSLYRSLHDSYIDVSITYAHGLSEVGAAWAIGIPAGFLSGIVGTEAIGRTCFLPENKMPTRMFVQHLYRKLGKHGQSRHPLLAWKVDGMWGAKGKVQVSYRRYQWYSLSRAGVMLHCCGSNSTRMSYTLNIPISRMKLFNPDLKYCIKENNLADIPRP